MSNSPFSTTYFHPKESIWEKTDLPPFDELILSWNGFRPTGSWTFYISLYQNGWSPWLPYAFWSKQKQSTFAEENELAKTYQDAVSPKQGYATGYRIRLEGDPATLKALWVCCTNHAKFLPSNSNHAPVSPLFLQGRSQMALDHPRRKDLCSPTSTSNAIRFLSPTSKVDPIQFAIASRDHQFDIFGNWVLNTAAAFEALEGRYSVYVTRLSDFDALLENLRRGNPLVVSVKGTIEGAPRSYPNGHLICVTGYDGGNVFCVDPAFSSDEKTGTSYSLIDFLKSWNTRRNLAYYFAAI